MKNSEKLAFPYVFNDPNFKMVIQEGLTKREYFAGLAMQGIVSNQQFLNNLIEKQTPLEVLVSKACVEIADELLKQLETPNQ